MPSSFLPTLILFRIIVHRVPSFDQLILDVPVPATHDDVSMYHIPMIILGFVSSILCRGSPIVVFVWIDRLILVFQWMYWIHLNPLNVLVILCPICCNELYGIAQFPLHVRSIPQPP